MRIAEIRRFPVKSVLGELVPAAAVTDRGLLGDRLWAVRDADGKLGSGKNTRRFRRMPGLFDLRGRFAEPVPLIELPGGGSFAADDPAGHAAVSRHLGRAVTIEPESAIRHHDEGPVSLITTAGLRRLADWTGEPVDPVRFRANLLVDAPGAGFPEDDWLGRTIHVGPHVVLLARAALTRCVMIDMAQDAVPEHGRLLRGLADHHDLTFGIWATVLRPGHIHVHDPVSVRGTG